MTAEEICDRGGDYLYGFGGVDKDYERAMFCFIEALAGGNIRALDEIGSMFECGYGVERDMSAAVDWYRRGAELGDTRAMNDLASCLIRGSGVEKNVDGAIFWYEKSAALGDSSAMKELARLFLKYRRDEKSALEWLEKSCGDEFQALKKLAKIYYFEMPDAPENDLRAFELFKEISQRDETYGFYVGEMYLEGRGVEKNGRKSVKWFKKAAAAGDSSAMLELAKIYIKGEFWLQDEGAALNLLIQRNGGNATDAMLELAQIYSGEDERADKSLVDRARALYWFERLYRMKNPDGAYYFGKLWEEKYVSAAVRIYADGVKFGDADCCKRLVQIYLTGAGDVEKNIPEAARWAAKYFDTASEAFCTCPFCSPFEEMKQIAKIFLETPAENLVELYGGDKLRAAHDIYRFGRACTESPMNLYTTLEIISLAADLMGDKCPPQILSTLADHYWEIYEAVKNHGVTAEIEGDAGKEIIKELAAATENSFVVVDDEEISLSLEYDGDLEEDEKNYHDAEYYREKSLHFRERIQKANGAPQ